MTIQELKTALSLPIIASPMFIISGTKMVIECCKNGIVGTFPSLNGRTSERFEEMLVEIIEELQKFEKETGEKPAPFGVNLIVNKNNPRIISDAKLCVKYKVPIVITSLGTVPEIVEKVHQYGGLVFHDVIKKRHAEKAAEAGVDGIICVAAGAGGHAGTANPFALIREIKSFFDGAIILAGSINSGNEVLAAQLMGADFAYMGTRFINTKECLAPAEYKKMIIDAKINDVIYTDKVSGVSGNFLLKSIEQSGINLENEGQNDFLKFEDNHSKAWKDIWSAGHGVTGIDNVLSVNELVNNLKAEYKSAIEKTKQLLS